MNRNRDHRCRTRPALACAGLGSLAATLFAIGGAWGAEVAGTLSPFATGAGGQGLGMGGAFVASADDASALTWNPGALARVTRLTCEADYSRFEASDVGEHFAALVLPSWRWGAIGFALRHQAVDGVEQRDQDNLPLPGSLSAGETEVAFGYGRLVAPGIGIGASVKLQREGVGPFASTGYGGDLGMTLQAREIVGKHLAWISPFSFGLAVRNVIEPNQRLDRESVPDPRVLRVGLAWDHALAGPMGLKVATDLERAPGLPTRLHVGTELSIGGLLSLRSGLSVGHLAAGTTLQWSGLAVEYVYEERDLGSVQRIGLSKAIGRTVDESREAERAAQERQLADRAQQEYTRRLALQVEDLMSRARESGAAGRLDDAMEAIAAARALGPDDPRSSQLEAALLRAEANRLEQAGDPAGAAMSYSRALEAWPADSLAAAGRRRAQAALETLASRSKQTRQFDAAYGLFAAGDLLGAETAFRRLHQAAPTDSVATSMLNRIDALLAQRIASRLGRAHRDLEAGLLDEAERGVEEARSLGADDAQLSSLRAALATERRRTLESQSAIHAAAPAPVPAGPTEAQRREADRYYRRGLELASAGRADHAVRFWELALSLDPQARLVREALEREYMLRGMTAFGRGRFAEAESNWARVTDLNPADDRARSYLQRARTQIERTRELTGAPR